jgi:hypothetical protein
MIRRRRSRQGFAMALMLIVLMVLTVVTITLVGTGVRDQQSARLSAGRSEARLLATSVLEDFFSRLKEDPTSLYDLLGSPVGDLCPAQPDVQSALPCTQATSVFDGYDRAIRRDGQPAKWAVLPSVGRVSQTATTGIVGATPCAVDDFAQDCFHVEIPSADRLGPANAPGSFMLRVNLRLRCGGEEARCIYSSFEQRVRRVQFYDFALAQEFTTLAPSALFPAGSFETDAPNRAAWARYDEQCGRDKRATARAGAPFAGNPVKILTGDPDGGGAANWRTGRFVADDLGTLDFDGCLDIAYQGDAGSQDDLGQASVYTLDDYLTVCGNPSLSSVFLSGSGFSGGPFGGTARALGSEDGCNGSPNTPTGAVFEKLVPAMRLPSEQDVLGTARGVSGATVYNLTKTGPTPIEITLNGATWSAVNANLAGGNATNAIIVVDGANHSATPAGSSEQGSLDVTLKGTVDGNLSIVVKGSAAIVDDLTYAGACVGAAAKDTACLGDTTRNDNALSVTASERIEIWQSCPVFNANPDDEENYPCVQQGTDDPRLPKERIVHAVLTSPEGYIGVPDWLINIDASGDNGERTQATLFFFGSLTSKYQGVFGGFADGELLSGYFKKFAHDERLTKATNSRVLDAAIPVIAHPPYLVESSTPVWVRLDLSEVAYQGS